jgi:hypothetical protein
MANRSSARSLCVRVVADNPETVDGLHSYLSEAGIASNGTRALHDANRVSSATTVVVLFPDDFRAADVVATVMSLRSARPKLLILLVTSTPQRFRSVLDPDGRSLPPIVLPKPAFGWTILDAIRAHAQSRST